ncbi:MAG TPA: Uma2 family endonuclease [Polyangiaceae bacterium]
MTEPDPLTPKLPPGQDELPCEDGEPMDTPRHRLQMNLLIDSLEDAWAGRDDYYVGGNMFVYFSELQVKKNDFRGPDVFVVLDTEWRHRKSWVAWEEGGKLPDVVIELTSPSTRRVDHEDKKRLYANVWRCPEYFIFDPDTEELDAYRLDVETRDYVAVPPDARGDYPVAGLQLRLGLRPGKLSAYEGNFLRWIDAAGEPLPTARERLRHEQQRAETERQRAETERQRAEDAERRLRELEAELRSRKS